MFKQIGFGSPVQDFAGLSRRLVPIDPPRSSFSGRCLEISGDSRVAFGRHRLTGNHRCAAESGSERGVVESAQHTPDFLSTRLVVWRRWDSWTRDKPVFVPNSLHNIPCETQSRGSNQREDSTGQARGIFDFLCRALSYSATVVCIYTCYKFATPNRSFRSTTLCCAGTRIS